MYQFQRFARPFVEKKIMFFFVGLCKYSLVKILIIIWKESSGNALKAKSASDMEKTFDYVK